MAENSKIEWTDHTFNPWSGCTKVAEGCKFCYAEVNYSVKMRGVKWGPNGNRILAADGTWKEPLKWSKQAAAEGVRKRVFCASLADVFEDWIERNGFPGRILNHKGEFLHLCCQCQAEWATTGEDDVLKPSKHSVCPNCRESGPLNYLTMNDCRRRLFALIDQTPHLDWLLLTKRPENVRRMWPDMANTKNRTITEPYRKNCWLGTSIATQADADRNIPELLKCRDLAPVLFVSAEPLIEPVDLTRLPTGSWGYGKVDVMSGFLCGAEPDEVYDYEASPGGFVRNPAGEWDRGELGIDWLIIGGESGPHARPCDVAWIRSLKDQCQAAGVSCFVKQLGAKCFDSQIGEPIDFDRYAVGLNDGVAYLTLLDPKGGDWSEWTNDLRVREFPKATVPA